MATTAAVSGTGQERRNRLLIIGAIVFGLITAVLLFIALQDNDGGGSSTVQITTSSVLVASRDVEANTILTEDMLELRSVPVEQVLTGGYDAIETAVGLPLRFPLQSGEQVTTSKVGLEAIRNENDLALVLKPGMRAFAVQASEVSAVGGLLLPQNTVDVIVFFEDEDGEIESVSTVLENIEVLAVAQEALEPVLASAVEADSEADSEAATAGGLVGQRSDEVQRQPGARTITLSLTPDQVQLLAGLQSTGGVRIWLSLRPADDNGNGPSGILPGAAFQAPAP